jgi:hypothetical protein
MIDDDYGAVDGMRIGKGNRSTRRKPAAVATKVIIFFYHEGGSSRCLRNVDMFLPYYTV